MLTKKEFSNFVIVDQQSSNQNRQQNSQTELFWIVSNDQRVLSKKFLFYSLDILENLFFLSSIQKSSKKF